MKKIILALLCSVTLSNGSLTAQEKMLIAGSGWDKVGLVDVKSGEIEWEFALTQGEDCNDIELTIDGNILLGCKTSARLVKWDKSEIWNFVCGDNEEINTATQLRGELAKEFGGEYLLAICGKPARFVILDKSGKPTKEITFDSGFDNVHGQFRQVLPINGGKFILPLMGKSEVLEINNDGTVLKRINVGGNPFSVKLLDSGLWAVACGDGHKIAFVDPSNQKVVSTIGDGDIKGVKLLFISEIAPQNDGSIIMTNWNGHSDDKSQPKLFKIDGKNKLIWSLPMSDKIENISAFYPIDSK